MIIVWFLFLLCFSYLIPCPLPPTHDPVSCINFVKHSMFSLIYSLCVFWMFPSFCGIFFSLHVVAAALVLYSFTITFLLLLYASNLETHKSSTWTQAHELLLYINAIDIFRFSSHITKKRQCPLLHFHIFFSLSLSCSFFPLSSNECLLCICHINAYSWACACACACMDIWSNCVVVVVILYCF